MPLSAPRTYPLRHGCITNAGPSPRSATPAQSLVERDHADQFVQLSLRQLKLGVKEPGAGVQDLEVDREVAYGGASRCEHGAILKILCGLF
jgi:hypothetical protein